MLVLNARILALHSVANPPLRCRVAVSAADDGGGGVYLGPPHSAHDLGARQMGSSREADAFLA